MEISEGLIALFDCEIDNEHIEESGQSRDGCSSPGGTNPATLESALDSLSQGLEIDGYDSDELYDELEVLIKIHGGNTEVRELIKE